MAYKVLKEERWSKWMLPLAPEARYLPTVMEGQFEEGKGEWVRRDDNSDGGVSLGPPSDGKQDTGDVMDAAIDLMLDCQPMMAREFYGVGLLCSDKNLIRRVDMAIVRDPEALEKGAPAVAFPTRDLLQRLDLPSSGGLPVSVSQRLGVPLQERVSKVQERRRCERRPHNQAVKRARKEAERMAKLKESGLIEEDDRNLQTTLLLDAASQPTPTPAPAAPYVPLDYPEDWYA
ncbi:hypothetical protein B0H16DRAFT_1475791 [Mycena metata]|uniref:Uncharacterized protein n=1 Tax=Mycena metata TaxID=1033252 RepID=A0AAD7HDS0_9AGAR|nr:hypothetical protein B0H16DRAFT_1475791 [Mycena metata]